MSSLGARSLVFYASAAVLLLEILAGRLLAPFVGVSLETFTAIIGTILAGIALGSWWGGRLADRVAPRRLLGPFLIVGGVLALLAPTIVAMLGPGFRGGEPVGIVLLTSLGFLAPAVALSAISPIVVKLRLQSLDETGAVVGQLSAVSTAGALFGTFVTGFVLISAWPTRPIVLVVGASLVILGAALSVGRVPFTGRAGAMVMVVAVGSGSLTFAVPGPCQYETAYVCAQVVEDAARPEGRALILDTVRHSYVDLTDPTHLEFRYIQLFADVIDSQSGSAAPNVLYIGGGGFTVPQWLETTRPASRHTVLELDPVLVDISESKLGLDLDRIDEIHVGDARMTIHDTPQGAFDIVVADAFSGSSVPWHLTTLEFLNLVDERMSPSGIYTMNVIDYEPHGFVKAEVRSVASIFEHVLVVAPETYLFGEAGGNFIVVASHVPLDTNALTARLEARDALSMVLEGGAVQSWFDDATLLTDDYAPVDQLLSRPG